MGRKSVRNSFAFKGYFLLSVIQFTKDFLHKKIFVFFCGLITSLINIIKHNYRISTDLCNQVLTIYN